MTLTKMAKRIHTAMKTGFPVLCWGPPGVGKTATIYSLANYLNMPCEVIIPSTMLPEDFRGIPIPDLERDTLRLFPDPAIRRIASHGRGILFLDEMSGAREATQNAMLRLLLEGVAGDVTLPPTVYRIGAANPPEQAAGGFDLALPTANRLIHLEFQLDHKEWADNFPTYWGNPPQLPDINEKQWSVARSLVASYIRSNPQALLCIPQDPTVTAWASPRTWDTVSRLWASVAQEGGDPTSEGILFFAGAVGRDNASAFVSWAKKKNLPDPEEILASPKSYRIPQDRLDILYAVVHAVASAVERDYSEERYRALWIFLDMVREAKYPDVVMSVVGVMRRIREKHNAVPPDEIAINFVEYFIAVDEARRKAR